MVILVILPRPAVFKSRLADEPRRRRCGAGARDGDVRRSVRLRE